MTTTDLATVPTGTIELATMTGDQLAGAWLASLTSEHTRHAYRTDLTQFVDWCHGHNVDPLTATRPVVDAYRLELEAQGRALSTIARKLAALSSFYDYATDLGRVTLNPCTRVKRPKVSRQSPTLGMSRTEAAAFLAAAELAGPRDYAAACLLLLNGLRVSELVSIDLEAIRTERGHTAVDVRGKGDKVRTIALAPMTVHALELAAAGRTVGPALVDDNGQRLNRHQVARLVSRLARAANVQNARKITPHSCRHTFVTLSLDEGVALHQVQDDAGHESPETTRRYDRARNRLDGAATYALAAALVR